MAEHDPSMQNDNANSELVAKLERILARLTELDPSFLDLDLDLTSPADQMTLALLGAVVTGSDVSISSTDDDGRMETVSFRSLGKTPEGERVVELSAGSTDGTLSADTAALLAQPMAAQLDDEIRLL